LCCVVSVTPGVLSSGFVPSSVAPKYLLSDICRWNLHRGGLCADIALPPSFEL
jgi:hypothetical protein